MRRLSDEKRSDPATRGYCFGHSALHCVFFTSQVFMHSSIFLPSFDSALQGFMHSEAATLHFVWH